MYEFVTHTWNPLAGECPHKCSYCSTNKLSDRYPVIKSKYSGEPRIDEKQMKTNLGKDNFIFICAQNDLFAEGVDENMVMDILGYCDKFDNKYLFQTKNPYELYQYALPQNSVVCTTIETNRIYSKIMDNCPCPSDRADMMNEIAHEMDVATYVTIEPIMDFDLDEMCYLIETCLPIQVNIGADSGNNNLPEPSKEKVLELISRLEKFTKVVQKKNLDRLLR